MKFPMSKLTSNNIHHLLILLGIFLGYSGQAFSQSKNSPFMAELSVSFMDYQALQSGEFFNYRQFDPGINMAGHMYLGRALNLSLNTAFAPEVDWITEEGQIRSTSLLDVSGFLQLKSNGTIFEEDALFAPYLATGFGMNTASNNIRLYVPATLGVRLQVSENFSLNFAATYKQKISANKFQHMAYTAGFVFAMSSKPTPVDTFMPPPDPEPPLAANADSDGDGVLDEDDLCPNVKGKVMYLGCPDGVDDETEEVITDLAEEPTTIDVGSQEEIQTDNQLYGANIQEERPKKEIEVGNDRPAAPISRRDLDELEFAMKNIYFEPASDKLKPESLPVLEDVARIMRKYPDYSLEVLGYTDNSGNYQNNVILSVMRAYRVKYYLVNQLDISMSRIASDGYTPDKPGYNKDNTSGRAKDRRVELKMLPTSEMRKDMFRGQEMFESKN